jgi:transcriptional regulator with XRE-family HTH domain
MNQPELGKKIAELRKAKGFTQEELVEKCNLSVRTLQRIESGEVTPRSYTRKIIFTALGYSIHEESGNVGFNFQSRLEQLNKYLLDLFNLKTNTMKKISVLSIPIIIVTIVLISVCTESNAQKALKVIKEIEALQNKSNDWYNKGLMDSVLTLYRSDACDMQYGACGKEQIREALQFQKDNNGKILEFRNLSISVSDSIAVQKYNILSLFGGQTYKTKGITEWRLTKGKWLIVNDMFQSEFVQQ